MKNSPEIPILYLSDRAKELRAVFQEASLQLNSLAESTGHFEQLTAVDLEEAKSVLLRKSPTMVFIASDFASEGQIAELLPMVQQYCNFPAIILRKGSAFISEREFLALGALDVIDEAELNPETIRRFWRFNRAYQSLRHKGDSSPQRSKADIRNLENALMHSESRFGSVMESLNEGITLFDRNGFLFYCNSRFSELTGYTMAELLGKKISDIFFPENCEEKLEYIESMNRRYQARRHGYPEVYETHIFRKDGSRCWVETKAGPLKDANDYVLGSLGANTDITERKRLETQLRRSQKMEAVGRLAGGVAHDFNNLLTSILGYSEILLQKLPEDDPHRRKIEVINESSVAACSLTKQLLTISKRHVIQAEQMQADQLIMDLEPVLKGLVGEDIELRFDMQENFPRIKADKSQLQQVVMNLAVNAKDAMNGNGVFSIIGSVITLDDDSGSRGLDLPAGEYVELVFRDSGKGMDDYLRSRIFEPFFSTKAEKGTGLGLSIIYGILETHQGSIIVESEPNEGTTFFVYLPVCHEIPLEIVNTQTIRQSKKRNEKILLAEDEQAVRTLVREILEEQGYRVISTCDGQEALTVAELNNYDFDLLLTDVVMPHINGMDLARKIMEQKEDVKVLLVSGFTDSSTIPENVRKAGIPFLPKPFSPDVLLERIRQLLDQEVSQTTASN